MVDAYGCLPSTLTDLNRVEALLRTMVADLALTPMAEPLTHQFPDPAGITGMVLLGESHLTIHTFPEHGSLCLNLFCCRPHGRWEFERGLAEMFGATSVQVRKVEREYAS